MPKQKSYIFFDYKEMEDKVNQMLKQEISLSTQSYNGILLFNAMMFVSQCNFLK